MKSFLRIMKALSDQNRVKAVKMLEGKELCACEIQAALGLAQPTVSKHLRILEEAGLVVGNRHGQWVRYRLPEHPESELAARMLSIVRMQLNTDPEITAMLTALPQVSAAARAENTSKTTAE